MENQMTRSEGKGLLQLILRRVAIGLPCLLVLGAIYLGPWIGGSPFASATDPALAEIGPIRASAFIVIDAEGKERATFGLASNGEPAIVLSNSKQSFKTRMEIDQTGMPRIALESQDGNAFIELGVSSSLEPVVILNNAAGKRRLGMVVSKTGTVGIALYDTEKHARCSISLAPDGSPLVTLKDNEGKSRALLTIDPQGTSALELRDADEKSRMILQVDGAGKSIATILDDKGSPNWVTNPKP